MGGAAERETEATPEGRRRAALQLIQSHDAVFRRTSRRYSLCADDADDAYQRALEILLTKAPPIEGEPLIRWMQTVTKREALAVRRQRERLLTAAPRYDDELGPDPLDQIPSDGPGPTDAAARRERVARSGEALRALKPQELRALTLKAEGYSYAEIGEITGWTYTKINRCMAEGRKRFLDAFEQIEQGHRCEQLASALSAVADGELRGAEAKEVQVHLRSCGACRAQLRAFRGVPHRVLELIPVGPPLEVSTGGRTHEWIGERISGAVDRMREAGYSILDRGAGEAGEGATRVAATGGARGAGMAGLAKLLAICGATAAGGAACVATGVVNPVAVGLGNADPDPAPIVRTAPPFDGPVKDPAPPSPAREPIVSAWSEPADQAPAPALTTPAQRTQRQFGFEASASSSGGSSGTGGGSTTGGGSPTDGGSSSGEFGGVSSGSGTGSAGGGSAGGGQFSFEK